MTLKPFLASLALAAVAAHGPVHATDVALAGNGTWSTFAVDNLLAADGGLGWIDDSGSALRFTFTVGSGFTGTLTVLDTGFAGDMFSVLNGVAALGSTSLVPAHTYDPLATSVEDPATALADASFSRAVFTLGAGSYAISGKLTQSLIGLDGAPLDSTSGALRLNVAAVTAVPEPSSLALMLAGVGIVGSVARRRLARR